MIEILKINKIGGKKVAKEGAEVIIAAIGGCESVEIEFDKGTTA